ncbi:MAG: 3-methyl-2-oxobutanoate hydroxymethyltransferase, partial [Fimbriimonadales bacterium]|nr:3-methyl-2-oxobutanoate hydroxymethyltransferase [Fimbriimonadales bacterium]
MQEKVTVPRIRSMKGGRIVCVTAYDAPSAELADSAGVDLILVGDSVGNVVLGYPSTLPVTLTEMVHHTSAVRRGCRRALLAADMPFGSYQPSPEKAVESAVALIQAGAEAVKLEGDFCEAIRLLTKSGIPVMGHIGMTPQSVHQFGGYRVQGRGKQSQALVDLACRIEDAGAFCLVL